MGCVLITGGNGFIGNNLLKYMEDIQSPICKKIVLLSSSSVNDSYPTILHKNYSYSKRDFNSIRKKSIETLIHIGAFTPKNTFSANDISRNTSNIFNTQHLLENLPEIPKKIIFISAIDVYINTNRIITEQTSTMPETLYGWSKLYCENLILNWCGFNKVIPQILRLGHIYGRGEEKYNKLIPETIKKIIKHEAPVIYSNGQEKRSYLHATDCARAIIACIHLKKYYGPINITSKKSFTTSKIVNDIIEISQKKITPYLMKKKMTTRNYLFDNSKMTRLLCTETISLKKGIQDEYNYIKNLQS